MEKNTEHSKMEKKYQFAIASSLRIGFLALLIVWSFMIIKPFIMIVFWGIIIAVGIYPLFKKLTKVIGNKRKLASAIIVLLALAIIIVPSILFTSGTVETVTEIVKGLESGTFKIPVPPDNVAEWPVVGKPIYEVWMLSTKNLEAVIVKFEPQITEYAPQVLYAVAGLGMTVLQFIISIIIAGALLVVAKPAGEASDRIFNVLIGDDGEKFTDIAEGTIRSVVQGVLGIALIQAILASIAMWMIGMPGTGIWALLILILAIMQLPTLIILIPVSIYVFTIADTVPAVIFLVWSILVGLSDTPLKSVFLGRGVDVPMLVILLGAIGGMLLSGIIGLFVGAVVLAITYKVFGALLKAAT